MPLSRNPTLPCSERVRHDYRMLCRGLKNAQSPPSWAGRGSWDRAEGPDRDVGPLQRGTDLARLSDGRRLVAMHAQRLDARLDDLARDGDDGLLLHHAQGARGDLL